MLRFAQNSGDALPVWPVAAGDAIPGDAGQWPAIAGFKARAGEICLIPDKHQQIAGAVFGLGDRAHANRNRFAFASATKLPKAVWRLVPPDGSFNLTEAALAWLLGQYRFTRYKGQDYDGPELVCPNGVDAEKLLAIATGEYLTRDLINTPANDMGPDQLEEIARQLAGDAAAQISVIRGQALLEQGFPLIHAVGRAAVQEPRLIDIRLGSHGPLLTLVGKGVCFDTGGLDIKPASAMGLMKKDMGGAATVLGLLKMIVASGANSGLRLRVLIPAVENSIAGNAFRPGDVLSSRSGLSVEINNTDAEGRLVLADAMSFAAGESPDLMISMATLTGAARVALGPDIPPFYCDDEPTAHALAQASTAVADPVWRMPFWSPYESMIEPQIADLDNAPSGGMAGSITAALFLRRFAGGAKRYAHFDIYGWQPRAEPGRPVGGVGQGARAIFEALPDLMA